MDDKSDGTESALEELAAEVRKCQRCPLADSRQNAVPGAGDANAVVMFVGEAPGFEEDKQGLPFVGRSGQFLTRVMNSAGIEREDVYITNVVKCRPPNNRDPQAKELEACSSYLDRQIELINPRIIVTLGRFSMRRWFSDGAITGIHGQIRNIGLGRVAVAMFHPAAALRNAEWEEAFAQDMQKLPALIERAHKANRLAEKGEALPAGVPHPGDSDYEEDGSEGDDAGQPESDAPHADTIFDNDNAEQLSLL